jgi:hypothetical protein
MQDAIHQQKVETQDALFRRILDAATSTKHKSEWGHATTRSTHRGAMVYTEDEVVLWNSYCKFSNDNQFNCLFW